MACAGGLITLGGLPPISAHAGSSSRQLQLPLPGPNDTCPVCGMFVAKYPEWVATIVFQDKTAMHFDGAKDFFKFLSDIKKYAPSCDQTHIRAMGVTDYYNTAMINAADALYVLGSDVLSPMGHDLIPHATHADAKDFKADHLGIDILRFQDITPGILQRLDRGDV
jgi:nitrous oxide reductase accessory protein NosL